VLCQGSTDYMGSFTCSVRMLLAGQPFELVEEKKKGRHGYKNSGTFTPVRPTVVRVPTLLDYIKGGCHINVSVGSDGKLFDCGPVPDLVAISLSPLQLMVGIDFTG
jgi:hypothetical protein